MDKENTQHTITDQLVKVTLHLLKHYSYSSIFIFTLL